MKTVISASRRTDIPAFYLDWFGSCLETGVFEVENTRSRRVTMRRLAPRDIHSIVFWSKNYGPLLGSRGRFEKYNLFFHFTMNTEVPLLEPGVVPLEERLDQARRLARWRGPETIMWRFDPVAVWEEHGGRRDNLGQFSRIAAGMRSIGVRRLTLSVMDRYRKIDRRVRGIAGFRFVYPDHDEAAGILRPLVEEAGRLGFEVSLCSERELLGRLEKGAVSLRRGSCIDGPLLSDLFGPGAPVAADRGQRRSRGCGCTVSFDVGSYTRHPCRHRCLYCYANPALTHHTK